MKYNIILFGCFVFLGSCASPEDTSVLAGDQLFKTVVKYVSFGEHRSASPADYATVDWLKDELTDHGYDVKFTEFSMKQFFLDEAFVTSKEAKIKYDAFPLWYVGDSIQLDVEGIMIKDTSDLKLVHDKIVLVNFSFDQQGQSGKKISEHLLDLISQGAKAIVGFNNNAADEIVAFNAPLAGTPWAIPIVVVSPGDAKELENKVNTIVRVSIAGEFKDVAVKNVYGTIGNGEQHIVVSTPISGWFTCGGERGPGVAIWLGLAKWSAAQNLPYTFVFTANSGHELGFWGAHEFLENDAPSVDNTKLWIHLGAGAATLSWKETSNGLVKEDVVDTKRNFFYTTSVKKEFDRAFQNIEGNKWDTEDRVGGELVNVLKKGYKNGVGVSYAHPYFHTLNDDAENTSPAILEETAIAFKNLIEETTKQ